MQSAVLGSRLALIGLAALRIYTGLYWAEKGLRQKLLDPTWVGPAGDCSYVVHEMLKTAPGWYAAFLQSAVIPNMTSSSVMVEWGEFLVGISLLIGLFGRFGALGGLFLVTNYFLGNGAGALHDGWFGIDTATFAMTAVHAILPTGLVFGVDGALRGRFGAKNLSRPSTSSG